MKIQIQRTESSVPDGVYINADVVYIDFVGVYINHVVVYRLYTDKGTFIPASFRKQILATNQLI